MRPLFISAVLLVVLSLPVFDLAAQETVPPPRYRLVGYYTSYSVYEDYPVTSIPVNLLTHLNYVAVNVSENGQCESSDEWADIEMPYPGDGDTERLRGNFKQLQILREDYPELRILMTVGGWEMSSNFSDAAATDRARVRFARSCIAFMRQYNFDGIDIDWRFPVEGGLQDGRPDDRENYTLLLSELRAQLELAGEEDERRYLLTVTAPATEPLYRNIELDRIHLDLDWINMMAFSFHGAWSELASPHAPLYGGERDPRGDEVRQSYSVDGAVNAYLDAGVPADKIVVGVGFFGQAYSNVRPNDFFGLYQPTSGVPNGTRPGGLLYYRDMLPLLTSDEYVRYFDEQTQTAWMYSVDRRIAISYENPRSIQTKAAYVRRLGLGGVMVWELGFDDSNHTLLEALATSLNTRVGEDEN